MSRSRSVGSAVALALTCAAPAVHAQQASVSNPVGDTVGLPTVTVESTSETAGSLTVPSVSEQRRQMEQVVGSTAFVDAASPAIQTRFIQDIPQALKDVPGVYAESRYGQEVRLSIRGSGIARGFHLRGIEVLQDGIPVNSADGSGDFYQIDPIYFRSIEVFKGGNALIFGTSTLGGAVNFVSPTAYTALAPDIVRVDGGSFGTIRGQVQVSRVIGPFDFLINGTFYHSTGYRNHSEADYTQINGNLGYRFSPTAETRFYFGAYYTRQKLPGAVSLDDALNNPTVANAQAASNGFGGNQARDVFTQRITNKTTLALDWGRLDLDSWFIHKDLYHPIFQVLAQDGYTWGVAPRLTSKMFLGGFRNDLIIGGRFWGGHNADERFVNFNGGSLSQTLNSRQDALNIEGYFEDRFFVVPEVALMLGAKFFSDKRVYQDLGGVPGGSVTVPGFGTQNVAPDLTYKYADVVYDGVNPKAGVMWMPTPNIQVFADFTGSRDVPDFSDLTPTIASQARFVPLAAQQAWTGEIGTRGRWDRFTWDFTAYRSQLHNELLQFTTNTNIPATTFNAPNTLHQGIEFAGSIDLLRDIFGPGSDDVLTLSQVWTWNQFFFVNDPQYGNNRIAGIPEHVLRTTLAYRGPNGLYIAPAVDWVPKGAYADFANTLQVPGYVLLSLQAGVDLPHGISLYVDARNLTDQHYVSDISTITNANAVSTTIFYPGNGRSLFGGLRYTF
jgi:iron complex outermembrane receptor protein